jgi:hypothetical protein
VIALFGSTSTGRERPTIRREYNAKEAAEEGPESCLSYIEYVIVLFSKTLR